MIEKRDLSETSQVKSFKNEKAKSKELDGSPIQRGNRIIIDSVKSTGNSLHLRSASNPHMTLKA